MNSVVIIPTYNESKNIEKLVKKILELKENLSIIIVDDNSPDGTGKIADELAHEYSEVKVIHRQTKLGLGTAYITGFKQALNNNFDCILTMDADFSHHPRYIPHLIKGTQSHDIMIGSRYVKGGETVNWSIYRKIISRTANMVAKFVLGLKTADCTNGFRCYDRKVLESIDLDSTFSSGYSFLFEMLYKFQRKGYKIGEVPIIFIDRSRGKSKITKKEIVKAVITVFKLKLKQLVGNFLKR